MEPVSNLSSISSDTQNAASPAVGLPELGRDDFLRMLIAQLEHQDPLRPMENAAFVAELAQFSELEQSLKQVKLLEEGNLGHAEALRFSMLPLVGRQVRIEGSLIQLESDSVPITYSLGGQAQAVEITIETRDGTFIRSLDLGSQNAGSHEVLWDGKDANGAVMTSGIYRYTISATDAAGEPVGTTTSSVLTVTGVRLEQGQPLLLLGEQVLDPSFVIDLL